MKNRSGELIVKCSMTDDTEKHGACATCFHYRNWMNCSDLHEGDEGFCDDKSVVTSPTPILN